MTDPTEIFLQCPATISEIFGIFFSCKELTWLPLTTRQSSTGDTGTRCKAGVPLCPSCCISPRRYRATCTRRSDGAFLLRNFSSTTQNKQTEQTDGFKHALTYYHYDSYTNTNEQLLIILSPSPLTRASTPTRQGYSRHDKPPYPQVYAGGCSFGHRPSGFSHHFGYI